ncbi:MAG: hypothetical protein QNJ45_18365 [Ardenticatenaceae bacterium]|nr:hypothetical protein [Ardenticatenaceae bacterium]
MSRTAALNLLQLTAQSFQDQLKSHFFAFLVYGSVLQSHFEAYQSDLNTILIVDDETNINDIRHAFLPLWDEHQKLFRRAPLVARHSAFKRYLAVFPALNDHLNRHAWIIKQQNFSYTPFIFSDTIESKAFVANELFLASSSLATSMRDKSKWERSQVALHRLKRRFKTPVNMTDTLMLIHALLKRLYQPTPEIKALPDAPYQISGLIALYEKLGDLIFIIESPDVLGQTDWKRVSEDVEANGFTSFAITTPDLFRLLVQKIYPLDHAVLSYSHVWGIEILTAITVPPADVLRDAARLSLAYEIDHFPNAFLSQTTSEEDKAIVIHDFQNKLLNIRLQNELLARLKLTTKVGSGRLPDKHASHEVRLQGIWENFGFWGTYFFDMYGSNIL